MEVIVGLRKAGLGFGALLDSFLYHYLDVGGIHCIPRHWRVYLSSGVL